MEARLDFLASNSVNRRPALKRPPPRTGCLCAFFYRSLLRKCTMQCFFLSDLVFRSRDGGNERHN